jgi:hypothetical protein
VKRNFQAALTAAFCVLSALISCGDSPVNNTGGNIVITYNANGWTGAGVPSAPGSCAQGAQIGAAAIPDLADTDTQEFLGWSLTSDGETIDASYKPAGGITLYVKWTPKTIAPEYVTMTYNANNILGLDMPEPAQVEKGKAIPAAKLPVLSGGNIAVFHGWSPSASGGSLPANPQRDFTVYANAELEFTEKLVQGNGQFALYRFALPEGSAFDDYTKIIVDYLVPDEDQINNKNAAMVLHGVYNGLMLEHVKNNDQVTGIRFHLTDETNEASIINNRYSSVELVDHGFLAGEWKTVEYALSGSRHGSFNNSTFLPNEDGLTRYIYFGLGITTAAGGGAYTSYIKNIRLSDNAGDKTAVSTGSGFRAPAFAASDNQWGLNPRETAAGTADASSGITLPYPAERHILANSQFALYRFDIPDGTTLGDYTRITADYMIENPVIDGEIYDVLEITDGRIRLMGAYTPDRLLPVEVSGILAGYRINMPPGAANDPSILNDLVPSSRLVKVGFFSGEWKEFEFPFTGNRPVYYDPAAYFPADASGTIYFGLGITTLTNRVTYTSHIRNIIMTNDDGAKKLSPSPVDYALPSFYAAADTWDLNSRKEVYLEK